MSYNHLRKGRCSESGRIYSVTIVVAGRQPVFRVIGIERLVVAELRTLQETGAAQTLAWVVMPDHVHWLFELGQDRTLAAVMNFFKGRSSRAINLALGRQGTLWQPGFHDHALRAEEDLPAIARYIVANPLRAGLVKRLGDYPLWDAIWL